MADWRTDDRELLARILMAEAGNQGPTGMTAVGNVVMNRANTGGYGGDIRGVIMKPGQFSPMNSVTGYAGGEQGQDIDSLRPSDTSYMVADALLSGNAGDLTGGATHFFNPDISNPSWAEGKDFTRIGDHVFGSADAGRGGERPMQGRAGTQGEAPMMQEEQQPRGLLGTLGIQKMEEGAPGEAGQRFYERDTFKDTAAALAQGFAAMGGNESLQDFASTVASQRTEAKARNKTVEYLRANGRGDLADMIDQGMISGKDAATVLLAKPEDERTALVKNYEYFIAQGMTPEQAMIAVKTGNTTNVNLPKSIGQIPTGYSVQYDDAGNPVSMSPIAGGPAEAERAAAAAEAGSEGDRLVSAADDSIRLINEIYNDPNLESITGMIQGRIPPMSQAGTDLNVKIEQAKGQVFMSAFESLKGAGAITENESAAATAAIARLQREQSAEAYRKSLKELVDLLDRGKRRAQAGVRASDNDEYGLVVGEGF